jgi:putative hemolysin
MNPLAEFFILLALILTGGVLAGAEIAVVAMRKSRVRELAASGSKAGRLLARLRQNPERFLSTVQVGITVLGATAAAFGGTAFAEDIEPIFRSLPLVGAYSTQIAFAGVILLISYLSIVLGELVPKSLALRATERYASFIAGPLTALATIARPLVWLLTSSSNLVLRLFGDRTSFSESRLSLEELRGLVDEADRHGSLPPGASELTLRALDLSGLTAADVMVHRRFVVSLPKGAGQEDVRSAFIRHGHHRFPVFDGTAENVIGYLSWREVIPRLWENDAHFELETLLAKPVFVPESAAAVDL